MRTRRRRERTLGVVLALLGLTLAAAGADARTRGHAGDREHMVQIVRATGLSDLALSSSSRWLRHPSLAEPNAASWDAPVGLDVDPAGAAISRPR